MAASDRSAAFKRVLYAVKTTGDTWFQPKIASTDSADYTADKAEALTQCQMNSPEGEEVIGVQ